MGKNSTYFATWAYFNISQIIAIDNLVSWLKPFSYLELALTFKENSVYFK